MARNSPEVLPVLHSAAIRDLLPVFDQLEIAYRIVGSVAGFLLGNPRSTIDVDILGNCPRLSRGKPKAFESRHIECRDKRAASLTNTKSW